MNLGKGYLLFFVKTLIAVFLYVWNYFQTKGFKICLMAWTCFEEELESGETKEELLENNSPPDGKITASSQL